MFQIVYKPCVSAYFSKLYHEKKMFSWHIFSSFFYLYNSSQLVFNAKICIMSLGKNSNSKIKKNFTIKCIIPLNDLLRRRNLNLWRFPSNINLNKCTGYLWQQIYWHTKIENDNDRFEYIGGYLRNLYLVIYALYRPKSR